MDTDRRIKKVINWLIFQELADNEKELAERLGYTKSSFSQLVNGKVPLSDKFVGKLCSLDENINSVWVMNGEGTMFLNDCLNSKTGDGSNIVGDNNNWNNVNTGEALSKALEEIGEQRKLTAKAQEQIDRLLLLLESQKQ